MLIDPLWIVLAYSLDALLKMRSRQWEHVLTRVLISSVYFWIGAGTPPIEDARILSRYFVFLLAIVEILSYLVRSIWLKQWKSQNLSSRSPE